MLPFVLQSQRDVPGDRRALTHGQAATILMQSGAGGMASLKDRWTEAEVLALPSGEHDFFDRKSGRLLSDMTNFQTQFAKALSGLVNSGGGHIVFGQEDNLETTGVEPKVGRAPMRQWLEQKLPWLVAYPLE